MEVIPESNQFAWCLWVLWCVQQCFPGGGGRVSCWIVIRGCNAHTTWSTFWLIAPCLGSRIFICTNSLSWWLPEVYQLLCACSGELHPPIAPLWELGSIWHYRFFRSIFGTAGHPWEYFNLRLLCSVCIFFLSSVTLHHKVGPEFPNWISLVLNQCLDLLVILHLPWFHSWTTT